ncbi:rhomboid family intramembrane serine protease [Virgibacillus halodenitrificans]|uniref:rhomboid family intramembrane serine protease n=1 Tax=Virgibacillus halodenitrificans TaxID=1482 RepID=UPI000EF4C186|nr:rhomboid family intramembrane serine protease [Virgibacillus halodenitrificans]
MYSEESHTLYEIAHHLVFHGRYEVLYINENEQEIWLEKYQNKVSKVIRIINKGFDWKNHLKRDIAQVFQKVKAMKRLLMGKHIEIHNVYVHSNDPVDDWEILKKPMKLNEKNSIKMNLYYLSHSSSEEEMTRLFNDLDITKMPSIKLDETERETRTVSLRNKLHKEMRQKHDEKNNVLSFGKPFLTYLLLAVNILLFILLEANGGSQSIPTLIEFGAKYNPDIMAGEWWRIVSSMFLHIGLLHLFMNMLAVYYLGIAVERMYGSWRFIVIYFLAGIGGGIASFAFSQHVSAGASGALFGLFGALLFFGLHYKKIFFQTMGKNVLILIGINILFGFLVPQIDNAAHLGGLIAGFIAASITHLPKKRDAQKQVLAILIYGFALTGIGYYGFSNNQNSQSYQLTQIEKYLQEEKYKEVVQLTTDSLDKKGDLEATILFQRSYAFIELGKINEAKQDLQEAIKINPEFPQAYYNLALVYYNTGEQKKAEDAIRTAYKLNSENEDFIHLYEQITGEKVD